MKVDTFSDTLFSKKRIYIYDYAAWIIHWRDHPCEFFYIREKLDLSVFFRGHSHIDSSHSAQYASNWREWVDGSSSLTLRFDTWNIDFCQNPFILILSSLNESRHSENPFNIAKNQEFELITSRHLNLISPKPAWNNKWSLVPLCKKFKAIVSLSILCPYFRFS